MTSNRRLWARASRLLAGVVLGTVVGLLAFTLSGMSGRPLFAITGGVAGLVSALVIQAYTRSVELSEVKVTIPQLSELTFVVNNDSRQVAWQLFVETCTRVSTQPLPSGAGSLREAMSSLYGLFNTAREILKASQPSKRTGAPTVEQLAVTMLNRELRPLPVALARPPAGIRAAAPLSAGGRLAR